MRLVTDMLRKKYAQGTALTWFNLVYFSLLILNMRELKSKERNESVFSMLRYINRAEVHK